MDLIKRVLTFHIYSWPQFTHEHTFFSRTPILTYPILIFDDLPADRCQRCPLAVGNRFGCTTFVHLTFAHLTREAMRCDAGQRFATDITVGRTSVRRGEPVMMIGEEVMLITGRAAFVEFTCRCRFQYSQPIVHFGATACRQGERFRRSDELRV